MLQTYRQYSYPITTRPARPPVTIARSAAQPPMPSRRTASSQRQHLRLSVFCHKWHPPLFIELCGVSWGAAACAVVWDALRDGLCRRGQRTVTAVPLEVVTASFTLATRAIVRHLLDHSRGARSVAPP